MARKRKSDKNLPEEKKAIIELLDKIKSGSVPVSESHSIWDKIYSYKKCILRISIANHGILSSAASLKT